MKGDEWNGVRFIVIESEDNKQIAHSIFFFSIVHSLSQWADIGSFTDEWSVCLWFRLSEKWCGWFELWENGRDKNSLNLR